MKNLVHEIATSRISYARKEQKCNINRSHPIVRFFFRALGTKFLITSEIKNYPFILCHPNVDQLVSSSTAYTTFSIHQSIWMLNFGQNNYRQYSYKIQNNIEFEFPTNCNITVTQKFQHFFSRKRISRCDRVKLSEF